MTEEQLIEGCKRGKRQAQEELYNTFSNKMMGVCLRYAGERETARDLLQEGFVKVFTKIKDYSGSGSFEGWMRKIFVNCALEYLRMHDAMRETVDLNNLESIQTSNSSPIKALTASELMGLIKSLPIGYRTVFNMFAIEGYTHKEISSMLNITESSSRSQLAHARQILQSKVNELY